MIPTQHKDRLPKHLAYPLGAQKISEALALSQHFEQLTLWFSDNKHDQNADAFRVAEIRYSLPLSLHPSREEIKSEERSPSWGLTIGAVPRALSKPARSALHEHGFQIIHDWLAKPRTQVWLDRSHTLTLRFETDLNRLQSEETER